MTLVGPSEIEIFVNSLGETFDICVWLMAADSHGHTIRMASSVTRHTRGTDDFEAVTIRLSSTAFRLPTNGQIAVVLAASSFPEFDLNNVPAPPILIALSGDMAPRAKLRYASESLEYEPPFSIDTGPID